jgi:hypothetical protein
MDYYAEEFTINYEDTDDTSSTDYNYDILNNFSIKDFILLVVRNGIVLLLIPLIGICLFCTCFNKSTTPLRSNVYSHSNMHNGRGYVNNTSGDDYTVAETVTDCGHDDDDDDCNTSVIDIDNDDYESYVLEEGSNNNKHTIVINRDNNNPIIRIRTDDDI